MFIDFEDRCTLFDTLILCRFYRDLYPWEELGKMIALTTGEIHAKAGPSIAGGPRHGQCPPIQLERGPAGNG
jgi:aldehyde:ferredoxin oxidoreductase